MPASQSLETIRFRKRSNLPAARFSWHLAQNELYRSGNDPHRLERVCRLSKSTEDVRQMSCNPPLHCPFSAAPFQHTNVRGVWFMPRYWPRLSRASKATRNELPISSPAKRIP